MGLKKRRFGHTCNPVESADFKLTHYPHPGISLNVVAVIATGLLLLATTGFIVRYGDRWRYLPVGWFWYLGTLVPVIGLVQVGTQGMADRYTHVPLIGLFLAAVWAVADLAVRQSVRFEIVRLSTGCLLFICAAYAWGQVQVWHSDETLWEHALLVTRQNSIAHKNLAMALVRRGQMVDAIHQQYEAALTLNSNDSELHNNVGCALAIAGNPDAAVTHFQEAVRLDPTYADAQINLAKAIQEIGPADQRAPRNDPRRAPATIACSR